MGELGMEVTEFFQQQPQFLHGGQNGHPEMIGALLLPKATPGHNADASLFQEAQAEEHVRGQAQFLSTLHRFQGQLHLREGIHGALHWVAADPGSLIEDLLRELSLGCQFSQHLLSLLQSREVIMEEGFNLSLYRPTQSWITRYLWPGLVCSLLETA